MKTHPYFLLLLAVLCAIGNRAALAQTAETSQQILYREYFDENWQHTDTRENARYYRLGYKDSNGSWHGLLRDFYISDTLLMRGYYTNGNRNGTFTYFYPNGKNKEQEIYENDFLTGKQTHWYANGQIQEEFNLNGVWYGTLMTNPPPAHGP